MKSDIKKRIHRTKPKDIDIERNLITGLIVSDKLCREVIPVLKQNYLQTKLAKTVCGWCTDFYKKYETSPKSMIQEIFQDKKDYLDPDLADTIEKLLNNLSEEYESSEIYDHDYWVDKSLTYLQLRSYKEYASEIEEAIDNEDLTTAEDLRLNFDKVERMDTKYEDIFSEENIDRLMDSYGIDEEERQKRILFKPPGALRSLMGDIERGSFIGLLGKEKVGKTQVLTELAMQCMKQGKNVAVFEVGDMTMDQFDIRVMSYITKKPARRKHAGRFLRPVLDCFHNQNGGCECGDTNIIKYNDNGEIIGMLDFMEAEDHVPCIDCYKDRSLRKDFRGSVWWKYENKNIWKWYEAKQEAKVYTDLFGGSFKRVAWNMGQANTEDIDRTLTMWYERYGFIAHLVLIDYADILGTTSKSAEKRHQEDEKWRGMRGLSQKWDNCVITATQSDAQGYNKRSLGLTNFNEDKRKYGHVTHFFSLNKTKDEEKMGLLRIGSLLIREDDAVITDEVTVLQSMRMGRPYLGSFAGSAPGI